MDSSASPPEQNVLSLLVLGKMLPQVLVSQAVYGPIASGLSSRIDFDPGKGVMSGITSRPSSRQVLLHFSPGLPPAETFLHTEIGAVRLVQCWHAGGINAALLLVCFHHSHLATASSPSPW